MNVKDGKRVVQSAKTKEMVLVQFSLPGAVTCHRTHITVCFFWHLWARGRGVPSEERN